MRRRVCSDVSAIRATAALRRSTHASSLACGSFLNSLLADQFARRVVIEVVVDHEIIAVSLQEAHYDEALRESVDLVSAHHVIAGQHRKLAFENQPIRQRLRDSGQGTDEQSNGLRPGGEDLRVGPEIVRELDPGHQAEWPETEPPARPG